MVIQEIHTLESSSGRKKASVLYVDFPKNQQSAYYDNFDQIKKRIKKQIMPKILQELNCSHETRVVWSQYAGCTCGCSDGFLLYNKNGKKDYYIVLSFDESDPEFAAIL